MYGSNSGRALDGQWLGYCGGSTTSKLIGVFSRGLDLLTSQQDNQVHVWLRNLALLAQDASVISASKDGSKHSSSCTSGWSWVGQTPHFPRFLSGLQRASTALHWLHLARTCVAAEGFPWLFPARLAAVERGREEERGAGGEASLSEDSRGEHRMVIIACVGFVHLGSIRVGQAVYHTSLRDRFALLILSTKHNTSVSVRCSRRHDDAELDTAVSGEVAHA